MIVKLLHEARLDLFQASRFYDRQSNGLGDYFLKCIFEDLERLEAYAHIHERCGNYLRILSTTAVAIGTIAERSATIKNQCQIALAPVQKYSN